MDYMKVALEEAKKAFFKKEVPVGAVLVQNGKIIAKSHNNREKTKNVLGHAEINVITKGSKKIKVWKLDDCDLYVTLKPCKMCEEIIKQARIRNVYYLIDKNKNKKEYDKVEFVKKGIEKTEEAKYMNLLSEFFKLMR